MSALLEVRDVHKRYRSGRRASTHAVRGVSFEIAGGQTVGLVGESGCGKSTCARMICRMDAVTSGDILFEGRSILSWRGEELRRNRRHIQMVFQNPRASFNPMLRVSDILSEAQRNFFGRPDLERRAEAARLLELVGLPARYGARYPRELSGGECQRVAIARALSAEPRILVCDEATSALDVSVQAQIVELLHALKQELNISYLFISHDLALVYHICDVIHVMRDGQILESGAAEQLVNMPEHPYSKELLDSFLPIFPTPAQSIGVSDFSRISGV